MHIWNEAIEFQITDKSLLSSAIKFTIINQEPVGRQPIVVASETFYFSLLFYNGHGIKDRFFIFKDGLAIGKVFLQTTYEPYTQ
jgi:hypothetical protein